VGEVVINVKNLSKMYRRYSSKINFFKELVHFGKKYHAEFWALRDISFEVKKGECVGIIGRNGSGKSTLLQVLCGILQPTRGEVKVKGRISALLELGAGFNLEFTGRDNVYMNGALMGFSKKEMEERFSEIEAFADIGNFINQPVKTYSSGMFIRLAFACAVNVDPDILIIDEALSVGDSFFQKRCFQKIEDLVSKGMTMIFVSHDQESIRTLTTRAILLKNGMLHKIGSSSEVVLEYRSLLHEEETAYCLKEIHRTNVNSQQKTAGIGTGSQTKRSDKLSFGDGDAEILDVKILNAQNEQANVFYPKDLIKIKMICKANKNLTHLNVGIRIRNKEGVKIYSCGTFNQDVISLKNNSSAISFWDCTFMSGTVFDVDFSFSSILGPNFYEIQVFIAEEKDKFYGSQRMLCWIDEAAFFHVSMNQKEYFFGGVCDLQIKSEWNTQYNKNSI
jgi:lipopolysaccharide transport system ATP-binding protein